MTISKETWVDLQEKHSKVFKLIADDSKLDPETDPYRSKYSAREILIGMRANLEKIQGGYPEGSKEYLKIIGMSGAVQIYLGTICLDTDELSQAEKHLLKCEEIIESTKTEPQIIPITVNMLNQIAILWFQRGDYEKSKKYLEESQHLYETFKESGGLIYAIKDVFNSDLDVEVEDVELSRSSIEKTHTFTLYYLAQVYGALGDAVKSAKFCHITLDRQYQMDHFEPIDWALNSATLSQFFMEKDLFKLARNHLAASSLVLEKYKKDLDEITERNEAYEAKIEEFRHRSADVARCWAKYGLLLLSNSKERLLKKSEEENEENPTTTLDTDQFQNFMFEMPNLSIYEAQITTDKVLTFQDSREVFVNVKAWLDKAESYYNLETLASDFVEIEQDRSQLYENLAFFEESPENQAKLHKRRADILEDVISKLNSRFYMKLCRQIWFELGQIYAEMLNIKSDKLRESGERPQPQILTKINGLVAKSLKNYQCFVKSFIDENNTEVDIDKVPEYFHKPYLQAIFYTAALSSRFITLDKRIQLANNETSLKAYKEVLDFCEKKFDAQKMIPMEFGICKEMVELLPVKIAKLKREVGASS